MFYFFIFILSYHSSIDIWVFDIRPNYKNHLGTYIGRFHVDERYLTYSLNVLNYYILISHTTWNTYIWSLTYLRIFFFLPINATCLEMNNYGNCIMLYKKLKHGLYICSTQSEKTCNIIYIYRTNVKKLVLSFNLHFWIAKEKQSGFLDSDTLDFIIHRPYLRRFRCIYNNNNNMNKCILHLYDNRWRIKIMDYFIRNLHLLKISKSTVYFEKKNYDAVMHVYFFFYQIKKFYLFLQIYLQYRLYTKIYITTASR